MITPAECLTSTATPWGSSRWSAYHTCRREHHLAYGQQIVPIGRSASYFEVGRLVHAYRAYTQLGGNGIDVLREAERQELALPEDEQDFAPLDEAHRLMQAYDLHYGTENAGWPEGVIVLAVEEKLPDAFVQQGLGYQLRQSIRLDARLDVNGRIVIADIKTRSARWSTDPQAAIQKAQAHYALRPQFIQASWMTRWAFGLDYYPPIWVDEIVKTQLPAFQRPLVEIEERSVELWLTAQRSVELFDDTPNPTACAPAIGSPCRYVKWCHGTDEERSLHYKQLTTREE